MKSFLTAALVLAAGLAPLAGAEPIPQVAVQTEKEKRDFAREFSWLSKRLARKAIVPGLNTDYIPQGVAWAGSGELVLLTHYWKGEKTKRPTLVSVVDLATGRHVRTVSLAVEGQEYRGHAGGIAVLGNRAWTGSGGTLLGFPLEAILKGGGPGEVPVVEADRSFRVDSRVSYISAEPAARRLWIGEYHRFGNKDYATASHHHVGGKAAWVAGYEMDLEKGEPTSNVTYTVGSSSVLRPDFVFFVRDGVQGMAMSGGKIVLAVSNGANDSKLAFYGSPLATTRQPRVVKLPGGQSTGGFVIDDGEWEETHAIPPGTEDLEPTPRGLLVTFESAAKPLRGTRRFWGGYVDDHVYLIDVGR